jgi:hypothetical protein
MRNSSGTKGGARALVATICRLIELPDDRCDPSGTSCDARNCSGENAKPLFDPSDVISEDEAAAILRIRRERLIRNRARYPFVKQVSRKHFICSRSATMRWLASRQTSSGGS